MKEILLADYTAGIVDTDGMITCDVQKREKNSAGFEVTPKVSISQRVSSYVAGITDGDGCIDCKVRLILGKYGKNRHHHFTPRIIVRNAETHMFSYLMKYCQLFEVKYRLKLERGIRKALYAFTITGGNNVKKFLEPLLKGPFFSKKEQAKLLLLLIARFNYGGATRYSSLQDAENEFLARMLIIDRLRELHLSGPNPKYTFATFLEEWKVSNEREQKIKAEIEPQISSQAGT